LIALAFAFGLVVGFWIIVAVLIALYIYGTSQLND
jgi:hypothetical protein